MLKTLLSAVLSALFGKLQDCLKSVLIYKAGQKSVELKDAQGSLKEYSKDVKIEQDNLALSDDDVLKQLRDNGDTRGSP